MTLGWGAGVAQGRAAGVSSALDPLLFFAQECKRRLDVEALRRFIGWGVDELVDRPVHRGRVDRGLGGTGPGTSTAAGSSVAS
jgi:hypothetical protein